MRAVVRLPFSVDMVTHLQPGDILFNVKPSGAEQYSAELPNGRTVYVGKSKLYTQPGRYEVRGEDNVVQITALSYEAACAAATRMCAKDQSQLYAAFPIGGYAN